MNAYEFANPPSGDGPCFCRGFYGSDVAAYQDRHVAIEEIFFTYQVHIRSLDHGIGRLYSSDETARLNHP